MPSFEGLKARGLIQCATAARQVLEQSCLQSGTLPQHTLIVVAGLHRGFIVPGQIALKLHALSPSGSLAPSARC
jgi:hypothetical protein